MVERLSEGASFWETLKGEGFDGYFIDANPPEGKIAYRLRFLSTDGASGPASEAAGIER